MPRAPLFGAFTWRTGSFGVGAETNRFVRGRGRNNRIGYNRASPWNVSDVPVDPILDALPSPSARRLAVRVTPDALRHVRAGHPWIFADSITSINEGGGPGDLAVVFDQRRAFAAIGLFDPASPIRIKVLHHGAPATIDESWWRTSIARALDRRAPFVGAADSSELGYRVINGENDGLPGLVVDRYADVMVVKVYSAAWFPHLAAVVRTLLDVAGATVPTTGVVLRLARTVAHGETFGLADGDVIAGELANDAVVFREAGLAFRGGHATRPEDRLVPRPTGEPDAGRSDDGRHRRARRVRGERRIQRACSRRRRPVRTERRPVGTHVGRAGRNMERNRTLAAVQACAHDTRVGDAFEVMSDLGRQDRHFGLVVIDPPSFAQRQSNVEGALRAYARLTRDAVRLVTPGGVLVQASCSSRVPAADFFEAVETAPRPAPIVRSARSPHRARHRPPGHLPGGCLSEGRSVAGPVTCCCDACDRCQRNHHRVRIAG